MTSFLFRMPAGVPGTVTRLEQSTVETQVYDPAVPFSAYGVAMKTGANGKMQPIAAGDTAALVEGVLVRPYPTTGAGSQTSTLGGGTPPASGICNRLKRGYIMVQLNGATAAIKDGPVYVRVGAASAGKPIGGFEAAADATPANTVLLTNAVFTGPADAQGNTEIAFNI
ncbi:hypothetical protein [Beijerinckia sp. L45]|uniref:structural cement protein Gp24 n=1 Tax=Beijerinckia sp. L45 TaxID=1641855 RepID=UPI00131E0411|nr:hypothetical protein [Beijerinckia sp. L45]